MTLRHLPFASKPHTQPTKEASNQESSYGDQHLWLKPKPATFTFKDQSSHGNGSPYPHVGKKGSQHYEDCRHYPSDHDTKVGITMYTSKGCLLWPREPLPAPKPTRRPGLMTPITAQG
jgi:hypothetical protein